MAGMNRPDSTIALRQEAREGRIFALTLGGGFLVLALIGHWRGKQGPAAVAVVLSALSLLAALLVPARLRTIRTAWMKVGDAIGFVTTPIMMTLVYYVVITPIALVRRAFAKPHAMGDSRWHRRPPLPPASGMERQF
jgi:saxitoxin biosynthesis operon SxtJ-like protein